MRKPLSTRSHGFSLIELLVVLTILGLLATVVGPKVMNALGGGKIKAAEVQIANLESAVERFYFDASRYPTTDEGLAALIEKPGTVDNWQGPYLKKRVIPKDPWKREYHYRFPSDHGAEFDIYSYGSDGAEGGEGESIDVNNWD
ncbi:MAG: type II secretion system major pseudopilin GspG [Methylococcales bacterium]|jgi:general secretion pathway protein G|nr:type II secretion system major pseudopilin GspG [Methylococcales bacterium]